MSKSFDEALKVWAKKYLAEEASHLDVHEIISATVRFVEASGYCETCYEDEHIDIDIIYTDGNGEAKEFWDYEYSNARVSQFELLQELFKEEE